MLLDYFLFRLFWCLCDFCVGYLLFCDLVLLYCFGCLLLSFVIVVILLCWMRWLLCVWICFGFAFSWFVVSLCGSFCLVFLGTFEVCCYCWFAFRYYGICCLMLWRFWIVVILFAWLLFVRTWCLLCFAVLCLGCAFVWLFDCFGFRVGLCRLVVFINLFSCLLFCFLMWLAIWAVATCFLLLIVRVRLFVLLYRFGVLMLVLWFAVIWI